MIFTNSTKFIAWRYNIDAFRMAPVVAKYDCSTFTDEQNANVTSSKAEIRNEEFNALLYIVVTLLFYSLGIIIGIITYLKRERREMEEDKVFEDFLTWQIDPFTTIKAKRVKQVAERLQEIEKLQKQRELELFRQELELGAGDPAKLKLQNDATKKLKLPRFSWAKVSWRRREDTPESHDSKESGDDHCVIRLDQLVAGCTDVAYNLAKPQCPVNRLSPYVTQESKCTCKSKMEHSKKSRNIISRQDRLRSEEATTIALLHTPSAPTLTM